jgi:hypothetical protein
MLTTKPLHPDVPPLPIAIIGFARLRGKCPAPRATILTPHNQISTSTMARSSAKYSRSVGAVVKSNVGGGGGPPREVPRFAAGAHSSEQPRLQPRDFTSYLGARRNSVASTRYVPNPSEAVDSQQFSQLPPVSPATQCTQHCWR